MILKLGKLSKPRTQSKNNLSLLVEYQQILVKKKLRSKRLADESIQTYYSYRLDDIKALCLDLGLYNLALTLHPGA